MGGEFASTGEVPVHRRERENPTTTLDSQPQQAIAGDSSIVAWQKFYHAMEGKLSLVYYPQGIRGALHT